MTELFHVKALGFISGSPNISSLICNEDILYLKSLADTRVFYERTIDYSDMHQILKEAILTEKDSIAFYLGMKEVVPKHLGQERLDEIIKEEMSHIKLLNKELLEIN